MDVYTLTDDAIMRHHLFTNTNFPQLLIPYDLSTVEAFYSEKCLLAHNR